MRILVVCLGNLCRSPMAEAIFRKYISERDLKDFEVCSAGITAWEGHEMSAPARQALLQLGVTPHNHRSRRLSPELVKWADIIYVMTDRQLEYCRQTYPDSYSKFQKLAPLDIDDPYGSQIEDYLKVGQLIMDAVRSRLNELTSNRAY